MRARPQETQRRPAAEQTVFSTLELPLLRGLEVLECSARQPFDSALTAGATSCVLNATGQPSLGMDMLAKSLDETVAALSGLQQLTIVIDRKLTEEEDSFLAGLINTVNGSVSVVVMTVPPSDRDLLRLALHVGQDGLPPFDLVAQVQGEAAAVSTTADLQEDFSAAIASCVQEVTAAVEQILGRSVGEEEPLMSAGLTSSDAVTLVTALEDAMGYELPGTLAFDYPSVSAISGFLQSSMSSTAMESEPVGSRAAPGSIADMVAGAVAEVLGHQVREEEPLMEAGLTSADAVNLVAALEENIGASLPGTLVFDYPSLEAISNYLVSEFAVRGPADATTPASRPPVGALAETPTVQSGATAV